MENIFAKFFTDVATVCGHEKTLHANFMHHLLLDGVPPASVAREHCSDGKRIDLVIHADQNDGLWKACDRVTVAFEFKGGAYNVRNALRDTIDVDGYCEDLDKLAALRNRGIESWFVCTDMAELGIALSGGDLKRVSDQCAQRGIHFAYHAQGTEDYLVARAGATSTQLRLLDETPRGHRTARWGDCLPELESILGQTNITEDTVIGLLYHALQCAGLGTNQISLETYFNCAAQGTRMHKRPDLCVFGNRVGGRFNLYSEGDPKRPNDGIKIGDLQAVIEVKGSESTRRLSERSFAKTIAADIEKLAQWCCRFRATGYLPSGAGSQQPDYAMIAVDNRQKPLTSATLHYLKHLAAEHSVSFHYLKVASNEKA